jgi:polyhydroxybutyrate depolymerase
VVDVEDTSTMARKAAGGAGARRAARNSYLVVFAVTLLVAITSGRAEELDVDGAERTYEVHVPDGIALPAPAMVLLHGGGGSGAQIRRHTDFNDLADEAEIVVVYPDGVDNHWNDGRDDPWLREQEAARENDVGFILALIDRLAADGLIDPARVGVAGISNGGMMTLRLACEAPDRFAAFAVVAANVAVGIECPEGVPVPMLFIHGTEDPLIPYAGGKIGFASGKTRGTAWSVEATLDAWARRNECSGQELSAHLDERPWDGTEVEIVHYTGCAQPLRHILVTGGGHAWPGTGTRLINLLTGRSSREIDGNEAILEFVAAQF